MFYNILLTLGPNFKEKPSPNIVKNKILLTGLSTTLGVYHYIPIHNRQDEIAAFNFINTAL